MVHKRSASEIGIAFSFLGALSCRDWPRVTDIGGAFPAELLRANHDKANSGLHPISALAPPKPLRKIASDIRVIVAYLILLWRPFSITSVIALSIFGLTYLSSFWAFCLVLLVLVLLSICPACRV
jgi:hypothetical protein